MVESVLAELDPFEESRLIVSTVAVLLGGCVVDGEVRTFVRKERKLSSWGVLDVEAVAVVGSAVLDE